MVSVLAFTACTPLDDVYTELDKKAPNTTDVIGQENITLSEKDYKELELKNVYFESEDQAKSLLPDFLKKKYDFWTKGSSVVVNYNLNNLPSNTSYTLTDADYTALGVSSLNSEEDIVNFLETKFKNTKKGDAVTLTYLSDPEMTKYTLTDADYEFIGQGKFKNFYIKKGPYKKEEERVKKISDILLKNFPTTEIGAIYKVYYNVYDGEKKEVFSLIKLEEESIQVDKSYLLKDEDYTLVGNGKYKNFDVRDGKPEAKESVIIDKINQILKNNFADATDGTTYEVKYKVYTGKPEMRKMILKLQGENWEKLSALSYKLYTVEPVLKTSTFINTGKWEMPYVLTKDDYNTLGQKYPNFSGKNKKEKEAAYKLIGRFLTNKHPYESAGTYKAVQAKFYLGGGKTETSNVNFIFDGSVWSAMPESVETTLQFGFDGKTWVPDNTIKYTLTTADYELIGNGKYKNFDIRPDKEEAKIEVRVEKISKILLNNFPDAEEGQKYLVTYNYYDGSKGTASVKVIKEGDKYVLFEE